MAAAPPSLHFLFLLLLLTFPLLSKSQSPDPIPATWPLQFHSILLINTNGSLQKTDLWYDYPNGRNFNIIQKQLGQLLYDLEWNNGTSYYYTLDAEKKCKVMSFPVGILRPDFLEDAVYVGQRDFDNFMCNVWKKVDFITYYEDVDSKRPVGWEFFNGMTTHVITFEVGKVLEDPNWQAPVYCFTSEAQKKKPLLELLGSESLDDLAAHGLLIKGLKDVPI